MSQVIFTEGAEPSTPSAGKAAIYVGSDGVFRAKSDTGTIVRVSNDYLGGMLVSELPAGSIGQTAYITDGDTALGFGAVAVNSGSGAVTYRVWFNGSDWTVVGA